MNDIKVKHTYTHNKQTKKTLTCKIYILAFMFGDFE